MKANTLWLIVLLGLLSLALIHGCDQDRDAQSPAAPEGTVAQKVVLRIGGVPSKANAKVTNLRIEAVGINENGVRVGAAIPPVVIANPTFPQAVELTLYRPPCRYRITITTDLSRDAARTWEDQIDICQQKAGALTIDVFESFFADQLTIQAPQMVNAGEALTASCDAEGVNAPDSAQYPLTVTLSERGGSRFDSAPNGLTVSGAFSDPYTATETERVLNCSIADGRSTPQSVTKTIARILPTPIPGVTVTPVPDVTVTPPPVGSSTLTVTKSGTGTGTVTSVPAGINCGSTCSASFKDGTRVTLTAAPDAGMGFIGWSGGCTGTANSCSVAINAANTVNAEFLDLCMVQNANDSGTGSLRQVLADSTTNGCSTITFAPSVSTITVSSELTITSGTLAIDGGGNVTISGGGSTGVFYVGAAATVNFQEFTITNGYANEGGGIYNRGTITVNGTVSNNRAQHGGGIYNAGGIVTINGAINNNYAEPIGLGGGIYNAFGGTLTVNGTVNNNAARYQGSGAGGIYNAGFLYINSGGEVDNNQGQMGIGAGGTGGGIVNTNSGEITIDGGTVNNNRSDEDGGGIWNDPDGLVTINSGTISGNIASGIGGGIYNGGTGSGGVLGATGSTVYGNTPDQCAPTACP